MLFGWPIDNITSKLGAQRERYINTQKTTCILYSSPGSSLYSTVIGLNPNLVISVFKEGGVYDQTFWSRMYYSEDSIKKLMACDAFPLIWYCSGYFHNNYSSVETKFGNVGT